MNSNAQNNVVNMGIAPVEQPRVTKEEILERGQDLRETNSVILAFESLVKHLADASSKYSGRELVSGPDGSSPLDKTGREKTAAALVCLQKGLTELSALEDEIGSFLEANKLPFMTRMFRRT